MDKTLEMYKTIQGIVDKLEGWAALDGPDEWTEYVHALIIVSYRIDMMTPEFEAHFLTELEEVLDYYNSNATVVEKERTYTEQYNEIEWSNR